MQGKVTHYVQSIAISLPPPNNPFPAANLASIHPSPSPLCHSTLPSRVLDHFSYFPTSVFASLLTISVPHSKLQPKTVGEGQGCRDMLETEIYPRKISLILRLATDKA